MAEPVCGELRTRNHRSLRDPSSARATRTVDGRSVGKGGQGRGLRLLTSRLRLGGQLQCARDSPAPTQTGATREQNRSKSRPRAEQAGARAGAFSWPDRVRRGQILGEDELDPQPWASALLTDGGPIPEFKFSHPQQDAVSFLKAGIDAAC